ncbi:MAG: SH3 domain-containing protein [Candidatus Wallbacteria bacterium]
MKKITSVFAVVVMALFVYSQATAAINEVKGELQNSQITGAASNVSSNSQFGMGGGTPAGTVRVSTYLNVRSGPGTNYDVIGKLYNGNNVDILEESGGWYKINYNGQTGWICGKYVSTGAAAASVSPSKLGSVSVSGSSYLNVRSGPGTDNSVIGKLYSGDSVTILEESGGWYKINYNGQEAWVCGKYVATGSAAPKPADSGSSNGSSSQVSSAEVKKVIENCQATGYFPPPAGGYKSAAEAAMEGGGYDCRGKKLRTLQDFNAGDSNSYVSVATDPRVIPTGSWISIDQYPGVRFLACDVGGGIKGNHIDICCANEKETYKVTGNITVRVLK